MKMRRVLKHLRIMSIVHGKSELYICSSIRSNLKIKHAIESDKNGEKSIQITSLMHFLNSHKFRTFENFVKCFTDIQSDNKKKLLNFKLFIIMDIDDCSSKEAEDFKNKNMFKNHWLYDYIEPIYNDPNLEKTMVDAGINIDKKKDYFLIFPTNSGDLDMQKAKDFFQALCKSKNSNLKDYVKYCIDIAEK